MWSLSLASAESGYGNWDDSINQGIIKKLKTWVTETQSTASLESSSIVWGPVLRWMLELDPERQQSHSEVIPTEFA